MLSEPTPVRPPIGRASRPRVRQDARVHIELPASLSGDGVSLRRLRAADAPAYAAAFRDDPELGRLIGTESDPDEARVRERTLADRRVGLARAAPGDAVAGVGVLAPLGRRHPRWGGGVLVLPR